MVRPPINDTIRPPMNYENPYQSSSTLQSNGSLCNSSFMTSPSYDSSVGGSGSSSDVISPPINPENPQRSPYRHPTVQTNNGLRNASFDDSLIGSSSSLDTIGSPFNPQLLPYPSATTLQSNTSLWNASFMTSPSYDSSIEVRNYFAESSWAWSLTLVIRSGLKRYVTRTPSPRIL